MSKSSSIETFTRGASDETVVRELLGGAGRRNPVPDEDLARLRAAAREQWRDMVARERERARFGRHKIALALAASLLLAVALGWWLLPGQGGVAPTLVASVELVRGDAFAGGAELIRGGELPAGAVLETGTGASGAALRLGGAQSVRLDRDTRIRLTSDSSFELERGAVYVDTHQAAPGVAVAVATPFGLVRDIGTQFLIRLSESGPEELRVRVREGEVMLEGKSATASARAGEELTLRRDSKEIEVGAVDRHGGAWKWIETVTPAMDIEGATLSDYLGWVSRETGRELRFADGALARSAETIILSGSIENLTPEQSLAILPGSGLGSRIENGLLLIEQPAN